MAQSQYTTPPEPRRIETVETNAPVASSVAVASPAPLGLNMLAFVTAIIGCYFAGFILPYEATGLRPAIGAIMLVGGIILVLAGMWEYRKNYMLTATIFTSYGGFLAALGLIFMPSFGIIALLSGVGLHTALGLFFLCWTIYAGVLFIGTLRTNLSLSITMIVLFAAFLLLTIGQLAFNNTVLDMIGGWLAIATALIAWLSALASITSTPTGNRPIFQLPIGRRLAVVE